MPAPASPARRRARTRLAKADRVVDNSGDLADLDRQVDEAWAWMQTLPPAEPPDGRPAQPSAELTRPAPTDAAAAPEV